MLCCGAGAGAGAGGAATFCWSRSHSCYKSPKFFIPMFEVDFKNNNFVAIYLKEPFDVFKKHENFLKP
jgi:hypothetical protein